MKNQSFFAEKNFHSRNVFEFFLIQKHKKNARGAELPKTENFQIFEGAQERSSSTFQVQVR